MREVFTFNKAGSEEILQAAMEKKCPPLCPICPSTKAVAVRFNPVLSE